MNRKKLALAGIALYSSFLLPTVAFAAEKTDVNVYYNVESELTDAEKSSIVYDLPDKYCGCGSSMVYVYKEVKKPTTPTNKDQTPPAPNHKSGRILPSTGEVLEVLPIVTGSFLMAAAGVYFFRKKGSKGIQNLIAITVIGGGLMTASHVDAYQKEGGLLSKYNSVDKISNKPFPIEIQGYEYVGYFKDSSTKATTKQVTTKVVIQDEKGNEIINSADQSYFSNAFGASPFNGAMIHSTFASLYPDVKVGTSQQALDWTPASLEAKSFDLEPVVTKESVEGLSGRALFEKVLEYNGGMPITVYRGWASYTTTDFDKVRTELIKEDFVSGHLYLTVDQMANSIETYDRTAAEVSHTLTGNLEFSAPVITTNEIDECGDLEVTYTFTVKGDYTIQTKTPDLDIRALRGTTTSSG